MPNEDILEKNYSDTLIKIHIETYKKTLDVYYQNQANLDKLIITILFAEVGFVLHIIETIRICYFLPLVPAIIGIVSAMLAYQNASNMVSFERTRTFLDICEVLKKPYDEDIYNKVSKSFDDCSHLFSIFNYITYLMLILTSVYSAVCYYIIKDSIKFNLFSYYFFASLVCIVLYLIYNLIKMCLFEEARYEQQQ